MNGGLAPVSAWNTLCGLYEIRAKLTEARYCIARSLIVFRLVRRFVTTLYDTLNAILKIGGDTSGI
jgi:hypothetical protein